ncbi:hypothetical protein Ancab_008598 [Ancistrocladus abbreviatus]
MDFISYVLTSLSGFLISLFTAISSRNKSSFRYVPVDTHPEAVGSIDVTCTGGGLMAVVLHGALMATSPQQEFGQAVDQGTTQSP